MRRRFRWRTSNYGTGAARQPGNDTKGNSSPDETMEKRDLQQDFQNQFSDVVTRLSSKQLFQSDWDIASFAIFFIFIGKLY
ncbi:hypothetical protein P4O66_007769 [Electrophorus voltai]|uniref:Uncharacterized protein n=1 Tax=Electrophorus voltai TaxID=2609070 RepID=A0AAD9DZ31_9TELE|nr:hypothetical protein P4O66_007769 [Electrophorus voltai]